MDRLQKQRLVAVGGEVINEGIGGDRYIGLGRSRWAPRENAVSYASYRSVNGSMSR